MMRDKEISLFDISEQALDWLLNSALPLWYDHGIDWDRGGFHECLEFDDLSCLKDYRRLRVLTRQIYVFSVGCRLGFNKGKKAVEHGLAFLLNQARLKTGGFANRFDLNGNIIDPKLDLYDLSFCLLALAYSYRLLEDDNLKAEAIALSQFIYEKMAHPSGGFLESIPETLPRRQNSHMHLFEATIEWRSLTDEKIFVTISDELIKIFFTKFFFSKTGYLLEFFEDNLTPLAGCEGKIVEPGHQFEWVWLLNRFEKVAGKSLAESNILYDFSRQYGLSGKDGFLFARILHDGRPQPGNVRLWPHTEWLKAELIYNKYAKSEPVLEAWLSITRFLDCPRKGLWFEHWNFENKHFIIEPVPATSLYHLTVAIDALKNTADSLSENQ
jgi:mannose-6-phosphate isomerase